MRLIMLNCRINLDASCLSLCFGGYTNRQEQNLYLVFKKEGRLATFQKELDSWLGWKWKVGWLDRQMNGWKSNFPLWLFSIYVFLFDSTLIIYNC